MTQFYLLRHGEIEWSETDCFIGQIDPPLSPQGRRRPAFGETCLQRVAFAGGMVE